MPAILEVIVWLVALAPALSLAIYSLELACGLKSLANGVDPQGEEDCIVLIPAHNEAAGIARTVAGLREVAPPGTPIVVVADNCIDDTAARATLAGAVVFERSDPMRRGKGYALAFGREKLASDPPRTVVVVDADCELTAGSIVGLCAAARQGTPAQAVNLIVPDLDAPAMVQLSNFAMLIKNLVRSRGLGRIGGGVLLSGTGMAFPWPVFATAPLATGDIAEDLGLSIALARAGVAARLVEQATVRSRAASQAESIPQRRRWEHGFLKNAIRHAVPTILTGLRDRSRLKIAIGCDLLVPPLALLFTIAAAALVAAGLAGWFSGDVRPALLVVTMTFLAASLTGLAWWRYGRSTLGAGAMFRIPAYILWKLPLYVEFLFRRENQWRRTGRPDEPEN